MKTLIIDTNVFLRFLLKDNDVLYHQAETIFNKAKKSQIKLLVPAIVIFEIDFVLNSVYRFPKKEIILRIESLLISQYLSIDEIIIFRQAVNLYKTSSSSFVDCFLISKAQIKGYELFTFDKKLSKLQG